MASYNDPAEDFRFAKAGPSSDVLVAIGESGAISGSVMVGMTVTGAGSITLPPRPMHRAPGSAGRWWRPGRRGCGSAACSRSSLLVRETNTKVIAFYERLGFEVSPRTVMAKWLTP